MKNIFIIVIASLVLIAGAAFVWVFFFSPKGPAAAPAQTGSVELPVAQSSNPTTTSGGNFQPAMNLTTVNGSNVSVNNFLSSSDTYQDPVNAGYYSLGYSINQTATSTGTPPFLIMYIASTQFFTIELLQEPIGQTRTQAELYLEQRLGLSPSDLCKLNYTLGVSVAVSQSYAGRNLGFSFCSGATVLPR